MFQKTLLASALALTGLTTYAADYYVVVPMPGAQMAPNISVTLNSATLPNAVVGVAYTGYDLTPLLTVTGDAAYTGSGVTWSVVSSSLPAGLSLRTDGTIGGTPTASGTGTLVARATYQGVNGEQTYQIVTLSVTVTLASAAPPSAVVGQLYSYDLKSLLSVTGDDAYTGADVSWSVVSSTLPEGLALRTDGTIAGTPTAAGTGQVTARATYKGANGDQTYQVVTLNINVSLSSATLTEGLVGTAYSYDLKPLVTVTGDGSYTPSALTWTLASGTLPAGLTLNANGTLTGTPTAASTSNLTFQAAYRGVNGQQTYQLVTLNLTVSLATATLPAGQVNTAYSAYDFKPLLSVSGDSSYNASNVAFSASGLPVGLALSSAGVLSGSPTTQTAGASFNVVATYKTKTGQQAYTIVVNGVPLEVTSIASGGSHTCAVTTNGGVKCWGSNASGQLGNASTTNSLVPVSVSGLTSGFASISAGNTHTCAVTTAGAVKCWGKNTQGQVGNNSTTDSLVPVDVVGLTSSVVTVVAGFDHTCALTTLGGATCWGSNSFGALGNNSLVNSPVPVDVTGLTTDVSSITAGYYASCVVTASGGAKCWGNGSNGQLGNGIVADSKIPVDVQGLTTGVARITAGGGHTCALTTSGGAKCWGKHTSGQLGDPNTASGLSTSKSTVPVDVSGLTSGVTALTAGGSHTCAILTSGAVKCWGSNSFGGLGNNSTTKSTVPVAVSGLTSGVTILSAGNYHTCAATTTGAQCWGYNTSGQLGNDTTTNSLVPKNVANP